MALTCAECGTPSPEGTRFCRRCGRVLSAPSQSPGASSPAGPSRAARFVAAGLLGVTAILIGAGVYLYESRRVFGEDERRRIEAEAQRKAEQKYAAELRAARRRIEDAEQARIDAEQQASHALSQQEQAKRDALAVRTEVKANAERAAARAAQLRRQAEERAQQEAAEKRRLEEAAAASAAARAAAVQPRPAPPPPPRPVEPQVAQASPEPICRTASNFITRGFCEARECIKPQYVGSDYCRSLRARATAREPQ